MTFETMDYLLVIAEERSINRASEKLFLSPQYLSKYLRNIEEEYGITIFNRYPSLTLTPEGDIFIKRIKQLHNIKLILNAELNDLKKAPAASLSFGTTSERASLLLPAILPKYQSRFPNVTIEQKDISNIQVQDLIIRRELDIGIALSLPDSNDLEKIYLATEPVYLAIADGTIEKYFPDNYAQKIIEFRRHTILQEFEGIPFILGRSAWRSSPALKEYVKKNELNINFSVEVSSKATELSLVSKGCGICTCPHYMIEHVNMMNRAVTSPKEKVYLFPLQNDIHINNEWYLCHLKNIDIPPYMAYFIELLKESILSMFSQNPYIDA